MAEVETIETRAADALVLFGVTGDLARKKLHPALYRLVTRGRLGDLSARQMLSPVGLRRYAAAALSGVPIRRPTEDVMRSPGIAILDADLVLRTVEEVDQVDLQAIQPERGLVAGQG